VIAIGMILTYTPWRTRPIRCKLAYLLTTEVVSAK